MDPQAEYDAWAQTPEGQQAIQDAQLQDYANGAASNDSGVMDPQAEYDAWAQTPEGQQAIQDAQQAQQPQTYIDDDGSSFTMYGDGSSLATGTDGSQSLLTADGTKYEIAADGTRSITMADGTRYDETQIRLAETFGGSPSDYQGAFYQGTQNWADSFIHSEPDIGTHNGMNRAAAAEAGFNARFGAWAADATSQTDYTQLETPGAHSSVSPGQTQDQAIEASLDRATQLGAQFNDALTRFENAGTDAERQQAIRDMSSAWGQFSHMRDDLQAHQFMSDAQHYGGANPDADRLNQVNGLAAAQQSWNQLGGVLAERGIDPASLDPGRAREPGIFTGGRESPGYNTPFSEAAHNWMNAGTWDGRDTRVSPEIRGYLNDRYHENFFGQVPRGRSI
jgi:hypothetical protein